MIEPMGDGPLWSDSGHGGGHAERQDTASEVLLQIALKFTVFLGFLLSAVMSQLIEARNVADDLQDELVDVLGTPEGQLFVELARSEEEAQKLDLFCAWEQLRPKRPLAALLAQLPSAERIWLEPAKGYLPDDPVYTKLMEAARVFSAPEADKVSREEVTQLLCAVWEKGEFERPPGWQQQARAATDKAFAAGPAVAGLERTRDRASFKRKRPSLANLCVTADRIRAALLAERQQLAKLQDGLVRRILPVRPFEGISGKTSREVLLAMVADLEPHLALLQEVEQALTAP